MGIQVIFLRIFFFEDHEVRCDFFDLNPAHKIETYLTCIIQAEEGGGGWILFVVGFFFVKL